MADFNPREKARYWAGVLYTENMPDDWEDHIAEDLQLPFAYAIHDKDVDLTGDPRKTHVHLMIAFPNSTTAKYVFEVMDALSLPGKHCISTVERVKSVRFMYEYLIHNTKDAKKKHKFQYPELARITGNGFDIGSYEQISLSDKRERLREIVMFAKKERIYNFAELNDRVIDEMPSEYFEILVSNSGYLDRVMNGRYQRLRYGDLHPVENEENEEIRVEVDPDTGEILDEE